MRRPRWLVCIATFDLPCGPFKSSSTWRRFFRGSKSSKTPRDFDFIRAERSSNVTWRGTFALAESSRTQAHGRHQPMSLKSSDAPTLWKSCLKDRRVRLRQQRHRSKAEGRRPKNQPNERGDDSDPGLASRRGCVPTAFAYRPDAVVWAPSVCAGPLTTSLRGLWVSGLLQPGNGGPRARAVTRKPTK